jgi:hypothetical protein
MAQITTLGIDTAKHVFVNLGVQWIHAHFAQFLAVCRRSKVVDMCTRRYGRGTPLGTR